MERPKSQIAVPLWSGRCPGRLPKRRIFMRDFDRKPHSDIEHSARDLTSP